MPAEFGQGSLKDIFDGRKDRNTKWLTLNERSVIIHHEIAVNARKNLQISIISKRGVKR